MPQRTTRTFTRLLPAASTLAALLGGCGTTSMQTPLSTSTATGATKPMAVTARGPQLGYLWDAGQRNIYPVLGVAGGAHYAAPVLGADAAYVSGAVSGSVSASAAGNSGWALMLDSSGTLYALTLPSATPSVIATRVPLDATISFAPAGAYAVVLSRSANSAVLVSGLPAQAQIADLAAPSGSALAGVAVSDRGTVLAGWTASTGVQVGTISATGATPIASVSAWGGAGFVPGAPAAGQEQAVIADAGTGQLVRVASIGSSAPTATALSSGGKLQTPAAVAISGDGHWAFAADSAKQQVVRVDLSGSTAPISIACACQPSRLEALPGNTIFEVSADQSAQPAWLLDANALAPRTFFVPALTSTAAGSTAAAVSAATTASMPKASAPTPGVSSKVAAGGAR